MSEWFIQLGYEAQLATWLVASFLLNTLASQLVWHSRWAFHSANSGMGEATHYLLPDRSDRHEHSLGHIIDRVRDHRSAQWVEEIIRLIYFLGIPFMAAVSGLLRADLLGIQGTDWVNGKSIQGFLWSDWVHGTGLATVAVLIVIGVWFAGRLVARQVGLIPIVQGIPGSLWQRLANSLYDQVHWAFYRSGPILWLNDLYWGTFAGLALVLLESVFNPALRWSLKSPETAGSPLIRLILAIVSALLFLATQNLWLTIGAHLILISLLGVRQTSSYLSLDEPDQ